MPPDSIEAFITSKLSDCLNFHCKQKGASFVDAIGALSVVTACIIQENARGNKAEIVESFKKSLDGLMMAMEKDEAVTLN